MRKSLPPEVEKGRLYGPPGGGPYGGFLLRCPATGAPLTVIASDGRDWEAELLPGKPWEHVSVSARNRCPTWAEMQWVKEQFWGPEELVVQFHPPRCRYVNRHPFVLHLWRWTGGDPPLPPRECV